MKAKLFAMLVVCSLTFSIPMQAQDEPPTDQGRRLAALQRILELTDSQAQQLFELRQAHLEQVHALWTQIRELEQQIVVQFNSDNPDPAEIGAIVIQQFGFKQQVHTENQSYHEAALAILTPEQVETVAHIQQAVIVAQQGGPLAAFGLIELLRRHRHFRRRLLQRFGRNSGTPGGQDLTTQPVPPRLFQR